MKSFELFNNGDSKGFFTLGDIEILNFLLDTFLTPESYDDIDLKDQLIECLNDFIEPLPDEDGSTVSLAELEGYNIFEIRELIKKIEVLTTDDVKLMFQALLDAKPFFETFLISDPIREINRLKIINEFYENGYETYKEFYDYFKGKLAEIQSLKGSMGSETNEWNLLIGGVM